MPSATTSDYLYQKEINYLFKDGAAYLPGSPPAPGKFWVALLTGTISIPANLNNTGFTEVASGLGYSRIAVLDNGGWSSVGGTSPFLISNAQDLTFGAPTGNWGTITACALYDAATGGNLYFIAKLTTTKTVNSGDGAPKILATQLRISRAECP